MKKISLLLVGFFVSSFVFAQNIVTASNFFSQVSSVYGSIRDYEANIDIKAGKSAMSGKVSFKRPDLLRIDFSNPKDQVICFNGDMLTIYLPGVPAILNQSVQSSGSGGASLATPNGLSLMSRYYSVAYETGQTPVPLDEEGSDELVVKLILSRRNTSEAFRYIRLAVSPESKLIRRIEGVTPQGESFVFRFWNYSINQGISDQRFIYDPPTSANNYNNFLFSE